MPDRMHSDRRANARYPLTLELRYSTPENGWSGSGQTIDVSSSGLSFKGDHPLRTRQLVKISLDWPVPLDGGVELQLVLSGEVVRTEGERIAMVIQRHEFRTRPGRSK